MFNKAKIIKKMAKYGANIDEGLARFLNDEKLYVECLNLLLSDDKFLSLGEAINKDEFDKSYTIAVALKGAIGNLEIIPLYDIISVIVSDLSIYDYSNLKVSYEKLMKEYDSFKKAMQ